MVTRLRAHVPLLLSQLDKTKSMHGIAGSVVVTCVWLLLGRGAARGMEPPWGVVWVLALTALFSWWHLYRSSPTERGRIGLRVPERAWASLLAALGVTVGLHASYLVFLASTPSVLTSHAVAAPESWRTSGGLVAELAESAVMSPLIEEVGFRGWLLRALETRCRPLMASLISAVVFAALHFQLLGFAPRLFAGLLFAAVVYRTGSVWSAVILHAVANTTSIGMALTGIPLDCFPDSLSLADRRVAGMAAFVAFAACIVPVWRSVDRAVRQPTAASPTNA